MQAKEADKIRAFDPAAGKQLRYAAAEAVCSNPANKITEVYATPYALSLGASGYQVGLLDSMQSLARALAQLPGVYLLERLKSRKEVWNLCSFTNKLFLVPLALLPFLGLDNPVGVMILLLAGYSFFQALKTPAWASLMADLVPEQLRGRFFGQRNMLIGLVNLTIILAAGTLIPQLNSGLDQAGFMAFFGLAVVLGMLAVAVSLFKIHEPHFKAPFRFRHGLPSWSGMVRKARLNGNFLRYTGFITGLNFSVRFSGPFVAVYVLRDLGFGLAWFAVFEATALLADTFANRYWGRMADRFGDRAIMAATGLLTVLIPLGWMLTSLPAHGLLVAVLDGFAWSGFNLAGFNYLLVAAPPEGRHKFIAYHSVAKELALFSGALAGATAARHFEGAAVFGLHGLQVVLVVGACLRMLSLLLLPLLRDTKDNSRQPFDTFWELAAKEPARQSAQAARLPLVVTAKAVQKTAALAASTSDSTKRLGRAVKTKAQDSPRLAWLGLGQLWRGLQRRLVRKPWSR